jgi:short-subunit dehydrogenase
MPPRALIVGNSDGIGLAATKRFIGRGWDIIGISRSDSPLKGDNYRHHVADVSDSRYPALLEKLIAEGPVDLCLYLAGIGELLDPLDMKGEPHILEVNLVGMVKTAAVVIPRMAKRGQGHFIGISSLADELISAEAPSYHASKAGFSNYLESLALALKPKGVNVTNVRFGFVDTKMAKGDVKPFMMSVEKAVDHLERCMSTKPIRYTAPKSAVPLVKFRKLMMRLGGA